jgi:hypothetical protein
VNAPGRGPSPVVLARLDYESLEDAMIVARHVLAGDIDPNLGCGLIAGIAEKLGRPAELSGFDLLAHEQTGHEALGITAASSVPDIVAECRRLVEQQR